MTITLSKVSVPGWDKEFPTVDAARIELLTHICAACRAGGEWEDIDENGITKGIIAVDEPPDPNDIGALLGTPCGCEYELIEE